MKRDALQISFDGHAPYDPEALKTYEFPSLVDEYHKLRNQRRQDIIQKFSGETLGGIICDELQKCWDECDKLEEEYFESPEWKAHMEFLLTGKSTFIVQP